MRSMWGEGGGGGERKRERICIAHFGGEERGVCVGVLSGECVWFQGVVWWLDRQWVLGDKVVRCVLWGLIGVDRVFLVCMGWFGLTVVWVGWG